MIPYMPMDASTSARTPKPAERLAKIRSGRMVELICCCCVRTSSRGRLGSTAATAARTDGTIAAGFMRVEIS